MTNLTHILVWLPDGLILHNRTPLHGCVGLRILICVVLLAKPAGVMPCVASDWRGSRRLSAFLDEPSTRPVLLGEYFDCRWTKNPTRGLGRAAYFIPKRFCDPLATAFNVTGNRDMAEFAAKKYIVRLSVTWQEYTCWR